MSESVMSKPDVAVASMKGLDPAALARQLAAAPHRLLFFVGATNVLLAMAAWALWLVDARWDVFDVAQPVVPAGWLHAIVMQYYVLPAFMFGFLLTVFPRWMALPAFERKHYVPVGLGLIGGQLLTLAGTVFGLTWMQVAVTITSLSWSIGLGLLARLVYVHGAKDWHAVSCVIALTFGLCGLLMYAAFLVTFDARWMFVAIKIGTLGLLLPVYFTVCHRMIPFFAGAALPGYQARRPQWSLAVMWLTGLCQLYLEVRHGYAWIWLPAGLAAVHFAWLLFLWWPRRPMPPLLRVLFVGFAWLPIAFALYAAQSAWYATTGAFILGRAPAHALFVGFFGSLLVAMVTRVTQGHSGRPLVLGSVAAITFVLVQGVAILRVVAEAMPDAMLWQAVAAIGWVVAFLPWVVRSGWIYLTPRADGRAG